MPNTSWAVISKALLFKVNKIRLFIHRSQWLLTVWPCPLLKTTLPAAGRCGPASVLAPFNFPSGSSCWQMAALNGKPFPCSSEEKQCPRLNWWGKEASSAAISYRASHRCESSNQTFSFQSQGPSVSQQLCTHHLCAWHKQSLRNCYFISPSRAVGICRKASRLQFCWATVTSSGCSRWTSSGWACISARITAHLA